MNEKVRLLRQRTKTFALRVIRMYSALPKDRVAGVLGYQALRAGTSVGAQYREACRSRSDAELVSKLESTLQEIDEMAYWLELLEESKIVKPSRLAALRAEADELTAIFVAAALNTKRRLRRA